MSIARVLGRSALPTVSRALGSTGFPTVFSRAMSSVAEGGKATQIVQLPAGTVLQVSQELTKPQEAAKPKEEPTKPKGAASGGAQENAGVAMSLAFGGASVLGLGAATYILKKEPDLGDRLKKFAQGVLRSINGEPPVVEAPKVPQKSPQEIFATQVKQIIENAFSGDATKTVEAGRVLEKKLDQQLLIDRGNQHEVERCARFLKKNLEVRAAANQLEAEIKIVKGELFSIIDKKHDDPLSAIGKDESFQKSFVKLKGLLRELKAQERAFLALNAEVDKTVNKAVVDTSGLVRKIEAFNSLYGATVELDKAYQEASDAIKAGKESLKAEGFLGMCSFARWSSFGGKDAIHNLRRALEKAEEAFRNYPLGSVVVPESNILSISNKLKDIELDCTKLQAECFAIEEKLEIRGSRGIETAIKTVGYVAIAGLAVAGAIAITGKVDDALAGRISQAFTGLMTRFLGPRDGGAGAAGGTTP